MENASNTKTLEMSMGSVLLVADVEDEKYYKAFSTFFGLDKTYMVFEVVSRAVNANLPIFVSGKGDVLEGVNYKDWNEDVLLGAFSPSAGDEPDLYMKDSCEKQNTSGARYATKPFYNYSKLVLGLTYDEENDTYDIVEDDAVMNNVMKYLIEKAYYTPNQFAKELIGG